MAGFAAYTWAPKADNPEFSQSNGELDHADNAGMEESVEG